MKTFYLTPIKIAMLNKNSLIRLYRNSSEYLIRLCDSGKPYFNRLKKAGFSASRRCQVKLRKV